MMLLEGCGAGGLQTGGCNERMQCRAPASLWDSLIISSVSPFHGHPLPRYTAPLASYLSRCLHYYSWTIASTGLALHRHVTLRILHMVITRPNVAASMPLSIQ